MKSLTPNMLSIFANEPRVFDLHLAAQLGFDYVHEIRRLVERNRPELEMHGEVSVAVTKTTPKGGRPGKAYYLNEGQALVLCALSQTPKAAEIRKLLIDVFMSWRRNRLPIITENKPQEATPTFAAKFYDDKTAQLTVTGSWKFVSGLLEQNFLR